LKPDGVSEKAVFLPAQIYANLSNLFFLVLEAVKVDIIAPLAAESSSLPNHID